MKTLERIIEACIIWGLLIGAPGLLLICYLRGIEL